METSLPIFLSRSLSRFTPRHFLSQQPMDLSDKSRSGAHHLPPPPQMILDPRFSSSSSSSSSIDTGFRPTGGGVIVENNRGIPHSTGNCLEFTATPRPASPHSPASSTNSSSLSEGGGGSIHQNPTPAPAITTAGRTNQVGTVVLRGVPIVALVIEEKERLCLAQISNTLLKNFSYNEIHNRRVALGITCVQCTPVQLEVLRRYGAMPISSRRCGMITRREAERLVTSFLEEHTPPKLPEAFAFSVAHACGWGCRGSFVPSRYNSSRAKCIKCHYCSMFLSPNKFIFHFHRTPDSKYHHPDAANFNSWRRHLVLDYAEPNEELNHAWEDVKAMFNGGSRKRLPSPSKCGGGGGGGAGGGVESRGGGDDDGKKRQCVGNKMTSFAQNKTGPICLSYPRMLPLGTPPPQPQQPQLSSVQAPYLPRPSPGGPGGGSFPPLSVLALPQATYYDAMKMRMMEFWKARNAITSSSSSSSSSSSFGMFWNKEIAFPGASVSFLYRNPMEPPPGGQQQRFVEAFLSSQGGACPGSGGSFVAATAADDGRFGAARFLEKPTLQRRMEETPVPPSPHPQVKRKTYSAFSRFNSSFDRMVASPSPGFHHHHHHHHQRAGPTPEVEQFVDEPEMDSSCDGEKQEQELINVIDSPDPEDDDDDDDDDGDDDVRNCCERAEAKSDDERKRDKNGNNNFRQILREAETEMERELELNQDMNCISNRILASQDGGGGGVDIMRPTPLTDGL